MVFDLHSGAAASGLAMHLKVDYTQAADREGFVVVYPSGTEGWNKGVAIVDLNKGEQKNLLLKSKTPRTEPESPVAFTKWLQASPQAIWVSPLGPWVT